MSGKVLKAVGWSGDEIGYYRKNSKCEKCKKLKDRSQKLPILSSHACLAWEWN